MQKKIIRILTFSGYRDHTGHLFKKLSILPVQKVNDEAIALFRETGTGKRWPNQSSKMVTTKSLLSWQSRAPWIWWRQRKNLQLSYGQVKGRHCLSSNGSRQHSRTSIKIWNMATLDTSNCMDVYVESQRKGSRLRRN